jgi:hypothetical protein
VRYLAGRSPKQTTMPSFRHRALEGALHVLEDGALGPGGDQRLGEALDVHVGARPLPSPGTFDRNQGKDPIGPNEVAVPERHHPVG